MSAVQVKKDDPAASGIVSSSETKKGITPGVTLGGKYLVCRLAGTGAFGLVYEAQNIELDEKVAIKSLRPEMLVEREIVARFAREAKAAASIKSEYVATVYDVGTSSDGVPYIVMEYLEGKDLSAVLQEESLLEPRMAVEFALQSCEVLAAAHAKGIVHRDIKPENLLVTQRSGGLPIIKVLDFGISKAALTGSPLRRELPIVSTVNMVGTPLYMSPEQVRSSATVDVRSDIWSLGMVLYEMLTGEPAFAGESITEICAAILETQPTPLDVLREDLPVGLAGVVHRCLEKDVRLRFQNVGELAIALMPFGPKRTLLNVERAVSALHPGGRPELLEILERTPEPSVSSRVPPAPMTPARGRSIALGLLALGLFAAGVGAMALVKGVRAEGDTRPPPATTDTTTANAVAKPAITPEVAATTAAPSASAAPAASASASATAARVTPTTTAKARAATSSSAVRVSAPPSSSSAAVAPPRLQPTESTAPAADPAPSETQAGKTSDAKDESE